MIIHDFILDDLVLVLYNFSDRIKFTYEIKTYGKIYFLDL